MRSLGLSSNDIFMAACPTSPLLFRCSTKSQSCRLKSARRRKMMRTRAVHCSATANEEELRELVHGQGAYLVRGFGWGVRKMATVGDEMTRVALVQAEAFHEPVALFNDFFFDFFKAEVLSALQYRLRSSPPDRYACSLVAESIHQVNSQGEQEIVGAADVTVQRDEDVLRHLQGTEEYLYVSGIAVLTKFRRKKVATVLLEACDVLSHGWGYDYLALRAYQDDSAAQTLYTKAGYRVVWGDPHWIAWMGKKPRVLMIKHKHSTLKSPSSDYNIQVTIEDPLT